VQAGALHAAGSKSKFKVISIPRLAWGAPVNVNVPHGTVLGPQPEIATVVIAVHKIKSFPIISASFLTINDKNLRNYSVVILKGSFLKSILS